MERTKDTNKNRMKKASFWFCRKVLCKDKLWHVLRDDGYDRLRIWPIASSAGLLKA
jgi:hypothetical protein